VGAAEAAPSPLDRAGTPDVAVRAKGGKYLRGFADARFDAVDSGVRTNAFDEATRAGAGVVRVNISWRNVTVSPPIAPENPADPAYEFGRADQAVRDAAARGLEVVITVFDAPEFAEGPGQPGDAPQGSWKPDPAALRGFAQAVATRYSGAYTPVGSLSPIPQARYFEAWNEQNLSEYLTPQYEQGKKSFAPDRYREMLNRFYEGVHASGHPGPKVVFGGTAPFGDPVGQRRTRPLRFMREVFCLNGRLETLRCPEKAKFDVMAHHPISIAHGPDYSAIHPDDAATADFDQVVALLRTAERKNAVVGNKHPVWATEIWWETNPPDKQLGVKLQKHARYVSEALHSLWKQGAGAVIWLQVIDTPVEADGVGGYQTGLLTADGAEKPAFQAFRFPFVVERKSKRKATVWTISPTSGTVQIQEKGKKGFRTIAKVGARQGVPVQEQVKVSRNATLRGLIGGEASRTSGAR
jgi:hypothetical protein